MSHAAAPSVRLRRASHLRVCSCRPRSATAKTAVVNTWRGLCEGCGLVLVRVSWGPGDASASGEGPAESARVRGGAAEVEAEAEAGGGGAECESAGVGRPREGVQPYTSQRPPSYTVYVSR